MRTNPSKNIQVNKKAADTEEAEKYFLGFIAFVDCTEQQIPRPKNRTAKKTYFPERRKGIP